MWWTREQAECVIGVLLLDQYHPDLSFLLDIWSVSSGNLLKRELYSTSVVVFCRQYACLCRQGRQPRKWLLNMSRRYKPREKRIFALISNKQLKFFGCMMWSQLCRARLVAWCISLAKSNWTVPIVFDTRYCLITYNCICNFNYRRCVSSTKCAVGC